MTDEQVEAAAEAIREQLNARGINVPISRDVARAALAAAQAVSEEQIVQAVLSRVDVGESFARAIAREALGK